MTVQKVMTGISATLASSLSALRERRLPWRLTQWIGRQHQEALRHLYDRRIAATRPFVTGKEFPRFEVHMLLGRKHVGMCLWAVKSFLNATNTPFVVVLHDDGSLTDADTAKLKAHLIDVRVVHKKEADDIMRKKLAPYPNCLEYRFTSKSTSDHRGTEYNMRIFSIRLFDFNLMSNATKTLVLDADVLFFKEPREIVDWAPSASDGVSLYSVEQYRPVRNVRGAIVGFERKSPTPTDANAGLLCFDKQAFDLDSINAWIGEHRDRMDRYATFEQAAYNYLIKRDGRCSPLPDSYSFNFTDDQVFATHFTIKPLFFQNIQHLLKPLS